MAPPERPTTLSAVLVIIAVAVSLCLVILTVGTVYAVAHGEDIGAVNNLQKLGKGGGLVGLAVVLYGVVSGLVSAARPRGDTRGADAGPKRRGSLKTASEKAAALLARGLHGGRDMMHHYVKLNIPPR
jgi:hypothetical protein